MNNFKSLILHLLSVLIIMSSALAYGSQIEKLDQRIKTESPHMSEYLLAVESISDENHLQALSLLEKQLRFSVNSEGDFGKTYPRYLTLGESMERYERMATFFGELSKEFPYKPWVEGAFVYADFINQNSLINKEFLHLLSQSDTSNHYKSAIKTLYILSLSWGQENEISLKHDIIFDLFDLPDEDYDLPTIISLVDTRYSSETNISGGNFHLQEQLNDAGRINEFAHIILNSNLGHSLSLNEFNDGSQDILPHAVLVNEYTALRLRAINLASNAEKTIDSLQSGTFNLFLSLIKSHIAFNRIDGSYISANTILNQLKENVPYYLVNVVLHHQRMISNWSGKVSHRSKRSTRRRGGNCGTGGGSGRVGGNTSGGSTFTLPTVTVRASRLGNSSPTLSPPRRTPTIAPRRGPSPQVNITPQKHANSLGYTKRIPPQKAPFPSHGQPVFQHPKTKKFITRDTDGHKVTMGWKCTIGKVFA